MIKVQLNGTFIKYCIGILLPILLTGCEDAESLRIILRNLLALGLISGAPIIISVILILIVMAVIKSVKVSVGVLRSSKEDRTYDPSQKKQKLWNSLEKDDDNELG